MKRTWLFGMMATLVLLAWGLSSASTEAQEAPGGAVGGQKPPQAARPAAPAVCGQVNTVPSPNVGSDNNSLLGVSALASNDVWAVGSRFDGSVNQTLVEHWNGTAWAVVASPNRGTGDNFLQGVSALASNDVWAVGYYYGGGGYYQTLVEHWDGNAWFDGPNPNVGSGNNALSGVSALSSTDVWVVGYYTLGSSYQTLVAHWDGGDWFVVPSPSPGSNANSLSGVSARASNDVWAVGDYSNGTAFQTLVAHWNGTAWSVVSSPNIGSGNNSLSGVSALASGDVWAVGDYTNAPHAHTLAEHWNGTAWSIVSSPNVGGNDNVLSGVSALAHSDVWAVGYYINGSSYQTLVEHLDGTAWSVVPSSNVGSGGNVLNGVSGRPGGDVWAVGYYGSAQQTLVEKYGGPCPCTTSFSDVHSGDYFYTPVLYLACRGVISGYADSTFRPYANTTRAQQVKIVVLGFALPLTTPPAGGYTFTDVPPSQPFFAVIETAAAAHIVSGYVCGGPGEPCDSAHRPYFRPYAAVTRGQLAKIDALGAGWPLVNPPTGTFADVLPSTAFYAVVETAVCHGVLSGYACGGPGEPCDSAHRPYFRQYANATRGQIAKIVYLSVTSSSVCPGPAAGR